MHLIGWGSGGALSVRATPAWAYADQVAHSQQELEGTLLFVVPHTQQSPVDQWRSLWARSLGRFGIGSKSTSSGALLQRHGRLSRVEYDLRAAVAVDTADGAFEQLLGEAFGTVPGPQQMGRLRWQHSPRVRTWKKSDAPQVYGAYALSAGLRPAALVALDALDLMAQELDTVLVEAMASDPVGHRRGIEALADEIAVWRADLLRVIQQRLLPVAYEYANHVPPVASSPCGVIRMASPEVPRGSLRAFQPVIPGPSGASFSWALAA
ncbi:hypothetical protein [Streptomyces sp. NPDC054901]